MRVIPDTNIIVDVLQNRMPWAPDGITIFRAVATRQITGCITTKQIADIHFFSRKVYKGEENVDAKARQIVGYFWACLNLSTRSQRTARLHLGSITATLKMLS